jgi:hypothetical protein
MYCVYSIFVSNCSEISANVSLPRVRVTAYILDHLMRRLKTPGNPIIFFRAYVERFIPAARLKSLLARAFFYSTNEILMDYTGAIDPVMA